MANFFRKYPKTNYRLSDYSEEYVTDLTLRFAFEKGLKSSVSGLFNYYVKDGDTPEIIASKIYGSVERHWIILLFNEIIDPQFDWPLSYMNFQKYVTEKYASNAGVGQTGLEWALSNTKHYYKVVTNKISDVETVNEYEIDATAYAALASSSIENFSLPNGVGLQVTTTKKTKTYYEYEDEINENKKTIKLLNPDFVPYLEIELERLILDGNI